MAQFKAPVSGMIVFNRYKLDHILGRGGMGVVWLAEDMKLERPVALKFLPSLSGLDPEAVKELKTETRRGLELSHPNIVRIYDFVDDEDAAAISMEFVDGKTLSEMRMTTEAGVFTVAEVSQWLPGVCDALDYAHFHRKVVHRDLKPANIMVTANGVPKIADFGIARSLADTMSRISVVQLGGSGTLPYMSPQQAMGERPLPTDDVYSLAATVYEMLAGKPPFYRGDLPTQITSKVPPPMQERRAELDIKTADTIPQEWETAIAMALQKDPAMRPASAGALAELLGIRAAGSQTWSTRSSTPIRRPLKAVRGRRGVELAAAAVIIAAAGSTIWWAAKRSSMPAPSEAAVPATRTGAGPESESVAAAAPPPDTLRLDISPLAPVQPAPPAVAPLANPAVIPLDAGPGLATVPAPPLLPGTALPPVLADPAITVTGTPGAELFQTVPTTVAPPESGFWELEQIFPQPPFATFSANGKRRILYQVQSELKKQGLYNASLDGKHGKGTHNAIVLFQVKNALPPHGLLDLPTLTALELADEMDEANWTPPSESTAVRRRRSAPPEKPPTLLDRMKKAFK